MYDNLLSIVFEWSLFYITHYICKCVCVCVQACVWSAMYNVIISNVILFLYTIRLLNPNNRVFKVFKRYRNSDDLLLNDHMTNNLAVDVHKLLMLFISWGNFSRNGVRLRFDGFNGNYTCIYSHAFKEKSVYIVTMEKEF